MGSTITTTKDQNTAEKKSTPKKPVSSVATKQQDPSVMQVTDGVDRIKAGMTHSQRIAEMSTRQMLAPRTTKAYYNLSTAMADAVLVTDLSDSIRKAGDEVVAGDLGRVERMLMTQAMAMDAMFIHLPTGRTGRSTSRAWSPTCDWPLKRRPDAGRPPRPWLCLRTPSQTSRMATSRSTIPLQAHQSRR